MIGYPSKAHKKAHQSSRDKLAGLVSQPLETVFTKGGFDECFSLESLPLVLELFWQEREYSAEELAAAEEEEV